jgi:hypothetical protein
MGKFCIFSNVYGENYQQFIPLYIYSILRNYPDYFVYIKVDREINSTIKKQLSLLPNTDMFKIVEGDNTSLISFNKKISDRSKLKRNATWLFYDDYFAEFEYLYIGDIDVFICREYPSLLEQHIEHCKVLNLPYSNFVRSQFMKTDKSILTILRILLGRGISEAKAWMRMEDGVIKRMTGLHFVKVEEYFNAVIPHFEKYNAILNRVAEGNGSNRENMYLKSNEILLYDLINDSGLGIPPVIPNNYSEHPNDYKSIGFRPMHGMHLGIFRGDTGPLNEFQSVSSDLYIGYYRQFCEMRAKDPIYGELEKYHQPYLKKIIMRMDSFYKKIGVVFPNDNWK